MILTLFSLLLSIAIGLIVLGIMKPSESYNALVGFFLLFMLSLVILNGNLEYQSGSIINTTISYTGNLATSTDQTVTDTYSLFNDTTSHIMGWYMAIVSGLGFGGVLFSLRRNRYN